MVAINEIIKTYATDKSIPLKRVASGMGITKQALYKMLNSPDIKVFRIRQISQALNHNFFQYYVSSSDFDKTDDKQLEKEIKELTQKVEQLQQEITYLKEINQLLKAQSTPK